MKRLILFLFNSVVTLGLTLGAEEAPVNSPDVAAALVDKAQKEYAGGNLKSALAIYREIVADHPRSRSYGIALYNIGIVLERDGRPDEAINAFETVLKSKVNNQEPGRDLMEAYRNYQHNAALKIAGLYEARGDFDRALQYANDASSKYTYRSWCGTCSQDEQRGSKERIKRLKALSYKAAHAE